MGGRGGEGEREEFGLEWMVGGSLIPRHQIFRTHPAALSKNRVWTLSLRKLGHVYIRRSVNWSNGRYIISYQQRLLCHQIVCKLAICDDA